jgi:hypothetical protein
MDIKTHVHNIYNPTQALTWYASSGHKLRWGTQFENDIEFARELTAFLDAIFDLIIVDTDGQAYHYDCPLGEGGLASTHSVGA